MEEHGKIEPRLISLYCTHLDPSHYHPKGFYDYHFPVSNGSLPPIVGLQFDFQKYDENDNLFFIQEELEIECSLWSKEPDPRQIRRILFKIKYSSNC